MKNFLLMIVAAFSITSFADVDYNFRDKLPIMESIIDAQELIGDECTLSVKRETYKDVYGNYYRYWAYVTFINHPESNAHAYLWTKQQIKTYNETVLKFVEFGDFRLDPDIPYKFTMDERTGKLKSLTQGRWGLSSRPIVCHF